VKIPSRSPNEDYPILSNPLELIAKQNQLSLLKIKRNVFLSKFGEKNSTIFQEISENFDLTSYL